MAVDLSAIARWPNVPACYDWLSLDRRGDWRLQGERVTHRGLIEFMNRQYACDESGCWFVQNGPQRVFVALDYTPWVYRLHDGQLTSHAGQPSGPVHDVSLDDGGNVVIAAELGVGLLEDRSLGLFIDQCRATDGGLLEEAALLVLMQGSPDVAVFWNGIHVRPIAAVDVKTRYKFDPYPRPPAINLKPSSTVN